MGTRHAAAARASSSGRKEVLSSLSRHMHQVASTARQASRHEVAMGALQQLKSFTSHSNNHSNHRSRGETEGAAAAVALRRKTTTHDIETLRWRLEEAKLFWDREFYKMFFLFLRT